MLTIIYNEETTLKDVFKDLKKWNKKSEVKDKVISVIKKGKSIKIVFDEN